MSITTVGEKFVHDLSELYDAELRFLDAQNVMFEQASKPQLKTMLAEHRAQTRYQLENLERIFVSLGSGPIRGNNAAAAGLVEAGKLAMQAAQQSPGYCDCVIASAAGQVEHYEIACYRNLIATAERFQRSDFGEILRQNLAQEEQTAQKVEESYPSLLDDALSTQKLQNTVGSAQPNFR